jgi:cell division septal protein FtsQ
LRKIPKFPFFAVVSGLIFAALVYIFAWSSIFSVSQLSISGAPTKDSQDAISNIAQIAVGEKIARVEPRAITKRLHQLTWIKSAAISRNWINGDVSIAITPRVPAAFFNDKTIDASGTIFELPGFSGSTLPRVSAPTAALGLQAIAIFRTLPYDFRSHITSLTAHNESNFSISTTYQGRDLQILWGANEKSALKMQVLKALLVLHENQKIRRVDLSAPHAPIVK